MKKIIYCGMVVSMAGCATTMTVQSNVPGATVYVTDYMPTPDAAPPVYESTGSTPLYCEVEYFAWEKYYVWVGAPGYKTQVRRIQSEVKPGPLVGGILCLWPLLLWSYGPSDAPMHFELVPDSASLDDPLPLYSEDGEQIGLCHREWPEGNGSMLLDTESL